MTTEKPLLKTPKVGQYLRCTGRVIAEEDITPVPANEIEYIVESMSARIELRINGRVVNTYATYMIHEDGICEDAIESAKSTLRSLGETDAEMVVVKITEYHRMQVNQNWLEGDLYNPGHRRLIYKDRGSKINVPPDVETVVWSSKTS
jgi:hypothetical protein